MSELWGSLFRLIEQQSKPVQIAAALILVVCVGVPTGVTLAKKFAHVDELVTPGPHSVVNVATESTPYKDGPLLAPRGNYETPDSARANDQKVAAAWHDSHSGEDSPEWAYIADGDRTRNFVKYRFFRKSDSCLEVVRSEDGTPLLQWIMNPAPRHRLHLDSSPTAVAELPKAPRLLTGLMNLLEPRVSAQADSQRVPLNLAKPAAAQSGCLNPHPGTFQSSWGPPSDQCWSPMYRRFSDGCVHFQMYNRCANAWDQRINWTHCVHG